MPKVSNQGQIPISFSHLLGMCTYRSSMTGPTRNPVRMQMGGAQFIGTRPLRGGTS